MKIVLIGPRGFLGNALLNGLSGVDEKIDWHLLSSSIEPQVHTQNNCFYHRYKWPQDTLGDETYAFILKDADVVIYAAGAGIQPGEAAGEDQVFNLNLFEPARLVQRLTFQGFKGQLITFGSYFETGINQPHCLLPEKDFLDIFHPLPNTYCRAKKELTHFHFVKEQAGLPFKWLHLILTNIYGPGEHEKRLIPYIIAQSKKGEPLHFTTGAQIRQYTYVGDVVRVVEGLLGKSSGLYHVTNEETVSVRMVIEETVGQVKQQMAMQPQLAFDLAERRDTAMEYLAVSAQKLKEDHGLSCTTTFKEGIALYFK